MRDYPIIDADTHVNVPFKELVARVPDKFKVEVPDRMPSMVLVNAVAISPAEWRLLGEPEDEERYRKGAWDPEERIKDMDIDYVDANILYGGGGSPNDDPEARLAYTRAYNDWLAEFCSYAPDRLFGPAQLPDTGADDAVAEIERMAGNKSIVGFVLNSWPNGTHRFPDHEKDDKVWSALEDAGLPAVVHVGLGGDGEGDTNALDIFRRPGMGVPFLNKERLAIGFMDVMSYMILGGTLERHPNLRFGCIESGVGWIPFFIEQSEDNWSRHRFWSNTNLSKLPRDYWQEQCFATFQIDHFGVSQRDRIGVDTIMWSSDYPHSGADWPFSFKIIDDHLRDVTEEERRKILCDNAARLHGLDPEKVGRIKTPGPALRR